MFDTKNDYSLNKNDPDAIVCRSVDGIHIRLTCKDFDSQKVSVNSVSLTLWYLVRKLSKSFFRIF